MKTIHFHVTGRVQGVYFRASTQQEAERIGLTGWVRNCEDGSVELIASGDAPALQALKAWLVIGPEHAKVKEVLETELPLERFNGFEIRY